VKEHDSCLSELIYEVLLLRGYGVWYVGGGVEGVGVVTLGDGGGGDKSIFIFL